MSDNTFLEDLDYFNTAFGDYRISRFFMLPSLGKMGGKFGFGCRIRVSSESNAFEWNAMYCSVTVTKNKKNQAILLNNSWMVLWKRESDRLRRSGNNKFGHKRD